MTFAGSRFASGGNADAIRALGRLPSGQMNKLEEKYAAHLDDRVRTESDVHRVLWWKFEAIKLRLADNTFYSSDFVVLTAAREIELHEVKGFMQDDANVKIKIAADLYPLFRFVLVRTRAKKDGGGWSITEIGGKP